MKDWLTEKQYNDIYSKVPRICVDLVIRQKKNVLLIKRGIQPYKGTFHLPGGRVKFRESITSAVNRIAINEIGIKVTIKKILGYMEFTREIQSGNKRHSISICFEVVPIGNLSIPKVNGRIHPVHLKFLNENNLI